MVTKDQQTTVTEATQAARQQALQEAGVTRVNTGTGTPSSRQDNPIADITDPKELLKIAMRGARKGGGT